MSLFWRRYYLLFGLGVLLILGFLATSLASYWVSRDQLRRSIADQELPLTGDNIYSEIQRDVMRPTFLSSLMAYDTFVRDWMLEGETDTDKITHYLKVIKEKYGAVSSFLVSDKTHRYYYANGVLKTISADDPHDQWYFSMRSLTEPYRMDLDTDQANNDTLTLFINYRLFDYQGNFIGVTGLGLTLDSVARVIQGMQNRFARNIYFVNDNGDIIVTAKTGAFQSGSIKTLPGIDKIAAQIINRDSSPVQLEYRRGNQRIMVSSRYIPEIKWYLVVEQAEDAALRPLRHVFWGNIAASTLITLLVLMLSLYSVNRYRRRLESFASTDALTGLANRHAFELLFNQAVRESQRSLAPIAMILLDIDFFKRVNDQHGHLVGDRVIQQVAQLLEKNLRTSDLLCRWGGEEFLILLTHATLQTAQEIAAKLCQLMALEGFQEGVGSIKITGSFGVAAYHQGESLVQFFSRVDRALYRAKERGRNRVEREL